MHRHPKLSTWVREEDGSYKAELEGFSCHVTWRPEPEPTYGKTTSSPLSKNERRGFVWSVEGPGDFAAQSSEVVEEIEHAMVAAEDAAAEQAARADH
jgi:hypothetical protein